MKCQISELGKAVVEEMRKLFHYLVSNMVFIVIQLYRIGE